MVLKTLFASFLINTSVPRLYKKIHGVSPEFFHAQQAIEANHKLPSSLSKYVNNTFVFTINYIKMIYHG